MDPGKLDGHIPVSDYIKAHGVYSYEHIQGTTGLKQRAADAPMAAGHSQAVVGGRSRLECSEKNHRRKDSRPTRKGPHASPDRRAIRPVFGFWIDSGSRAPVRSSGPILSHHLGCRRGSAHRAFCSLLWAHRSGAPFDQKISSRIFISEPDHFQGSL